MTAEVHGRALLDRATRRFADLPPRARLALVRAWVRGPGQRLRLLHNDIVGIGYGYRTRGLDQSICLSEPCVTFLVRRKWTRRAPLSDRHVLPRVVLARARIEGDTRRYAIPTDVVCAGAFRDIRQQTSRVLASSATVGKQLGPLCCATRLEGEGQLYGIGCHHVLALSNLTAAVPKRVDVFTEAPPISTVGELSTFRGDVDDRGLFFDAALAAISNPTALNRVLNEPFPGTLVLTQELNLPRNVSIHSFHGGLISGTVRRVWHGPDGPHPPIDYRNLETAFHPNVVSKTVVEVQPERHTRGGDSGSPVFSMGGGMLLGMHVAGNRSEPPTSMFIPAFELLRARNYHLASGDEMLTLAFPPY